MIYAGSPKHKEPWQRGRRGTLCPSWSRSKAQEIFDASIPSNDGNARFGVYDGWAFAAREDGTGVWHGYPVAWNEVDTVIVNDWIRQKTVKRSQVNRRWIFDDETLQALYHDD